MPSNTVDLRNISKSEQAVILQVIQRDKALRKNEDQRLKYVCKTILEDKLCSLCKFTIVCFTTFLANSFVL